MSSDNRVGSGPPPEGLATLYAAEQPGLRSLAYLLTGSVSAADDLVQDAFAAIAPRLAEVVNPAAYLRTVVVNGSRRAHGRAAAFQRWAAGAGSDANADAAGQLHGATSSPTDRLVVRQALAELPPAQREAIVLRFFADLTYREIGELVGCPTQTVATNVRRGLARLRSHLEDQ